MNGIRQIFCKEMARIFRDKKMVFSVFLLPVIVMVAILTIINNLAGQMQSDIESHRSIVWVQNEPESFRAFREAAGLDCDMETVSSRRTTKRPGRRSWKGTRISSSNSRRTLTRRSPHSGRGTRCPR